MKVGDKVRAQFMTVPEEFPGKARGEKLYPLRTGVVTYRNSERVVEERPEEVRRGAM